MTRKVVEAEGSGGSSGPSRKGFSISSGRSKGIPGPHGPQPCEKGTGKFVNLDKNQRQALIDQIDRKLDDD
jgi:hypothetical protein